MKTQVKQGMPGEVAALRERIEDWRRTRKSVGLMPEELWEAAVEAGRKYGAHRAGRMLGVNRHALKARLEKAEGGGQKDIAGDVGFVELRSSGGSGRDAGLGWEVEMSDGRGRTMRMRTGSAEATELRALADSFWRAGQ